MFSPPPSREVQDLRNTSIKVLLTVPALQLFIEGPSSLLHPTAGPTFTSHGLFK